MVELASKDAHCWSKLDCRWVEESLFSLPCWGYYRLCRLLYIDLSMRCKGLKQSDFIRNATINAAFNKIGFKANL